MAYPSDQICAPNICSVVDVSAHTTYGGSHPSVPVYSGQPISSDLVGTDYENYLTDSLTSCAVGACGCCGEGGYCHAEPRTLWSDVC